MKMHALSGIRAHNPSNQAAAGLHLILHSHRDRPHVILHHLIIINDLSPHAASLSVSRNMVNEEDHAKGINM